MERIEAFLVFVALLAVGGSLRAQDRTKLALLVGCSEYGEFDLDSAKNDCQQLGDVLRKRGGYETRLWGDGFGKPGDGVEKTGARLLQWIEDRLVTSVPDGGWEQVLFYYVGHGVEKGGDVYLALDAPLARSWYSIGTPDTWLSVEKVGAAIGTASTSTIVVLDCCKSGAGTEVDPRDSALIDAIKHDPLGFSVRYASCVAERTSYCNPIEDFQRALEFELCLPSARVDHLCPARGAGHSHSTFNFFLTRALRGRADGVAYDVGREPPDSCEPTAMCLELELGERDDGIDLVEASSYVLAGMLVMEGITHFPQLPWMDKSLHGGRLKIVPSPEFPLSRHIAAWTDELHRKYPRSTVGFTRHDVQGAEGRPLVRPGWTAATLDGLMLALDAELGPSRADRFFEIEVHEDPVLGTSTALVTFADDESRLGFRRTGDRFDVLPLP